jgi:hypothetical protein
LPDGSLIDADSQFVKTWRMRNDCTLEWPIGTSLRWVSGHRFTGDTEFPVPAIGAGQECDISAQFTAPSQPGRCVSYFRLCTPDGTQFGHRVWVDIVVANAPVAQQPVAATTNNNNPTAPVYPPSPSPSPTAPPAPAEPATPPAEPAYHVPPRFKLGVETLRSMGFVDDELSVALLERYNGDVEQALDNFLVK